jgi:ArsR family transcriptional regulator
LINVFKTLSDKTRLRIINILDKEELNVQEIVDIIGGAQSGISRHLSVLKNSGFINDRKEGTWTYYSVNKTGNGFKKEILNKIEELLEKDSEFNQDNEKLKRVIEQRRQITKNFFDKTTTGYDDLTGIYEHERIRLLSMLHLIPHNLNVIDLGCGTGNFLPFLASINANIAAVDSSETMLEQAKKRMKGYPDINFYLSDILEVKLENNWADACFVNMVLHHIAKPSEVFSYLKPLIKPDGFLIITDFIKHSDENMRNKYGDLWLGFENNELITWIEKSGFYKVFADKIRMKDKNVFIISAKKK